MNGERCGSMVDHPLHFGSDDNTLVNMVDLFDKVPNGTSSAIKESSRRSSPCPPSDRNR